MASKRQIVEFLKRDDLIALADRYEVEVADRRIRDDLVDALVAARRVGAEDVLEGFSRDMLKALCVDLGLDDTGREKAVLVARILGRDGSHAARPALKETGVDGSWIRQGRKALGLTQGEFGERMDVHQVTVSNWETGKSEPDGAQRARLEALFGGKRPAEPIVAEKPPPAPEAPTRPARGRGRAAKKKNGEAAAELGFERKLFQAADKLRNNMDAAEYKHVVLGLIFLKYISDAFEERHAQLLSEVDEGADPEDADEYRAEGVFWVPKEARWPYLQGHAKQPTIGKLLDDAMDAIERDNRSLKGVLPKQYARPALDKQRLGELIDLIGTIGLGDAENRSKDILGRVYEYFLSEFASAEGKKGGQFYTPQSVVKLLVEMIEPLKGRVYDPCCGSGGMFVQSERFVEAHGGRIGDISVYGQESNNTTWRLAKMNLAIRGIDSNLGPHHADTFHRDVHPDLKADYLLANPPFNDSDWGGDRLRDDVRWTYGTPPAGNANFAWVQHFIHHLAPNGVAGFVLANGSMSSNQSGEGEIRKAIVEADLVDCMVALPTQLFYSTGIPACLWFFARNKSNGRFRDRRGEVLFINARKLGRMIDRTHRELTDDEVERVARTYHAWRGESDAGAYEDIPGFCKAAKRDEIAEHGFVLTPGRYVGAEDAEDDDEEPFEPRMQRLIEGLREQLREGEVLNAQLKQAMRALGHEL